MWKCDSDHITIVVTTSLTIYLKLHTSLLDITLKANQSVAVISCLYKTVVPSKLNVPGLTEKQLIEHLVGVFTRYKTVVLSIYELTEKKYKNIYECVRELSIVKLHTHFLKIQDCNLLKLFPSLENLTVKNNPISGSFLVQNFSSLSVTYMTLDHLLISNCSRFCISKQRFSDKDLNLFMRSWIKGSNPRLRSLGFTHSPFHWVEPVVFRGIDYTEPWKQRGSIRKHVELVRYDGSKADVTIDRSSFWFYVK